MNYNVEHREGDKKASNLLVDKDQKKLYLSANTYTS